MQSHIPCKCGHGRGNHLSHYVNATGVFFPNVCKSCWNYCYEFKQDNLKYLEIKSLEKLGLDK